MDVAYDRAVDVNSRRLNVATKAEAVYIELRNRILEGDLEQSSVLHQEALAAELGVSVTPLREALRRLEAENLVRLQAHKTVSITPLTRRELTELYQVRLQLDPWAASLAALNATDAELAEIKRLAKKPALPEPTQQLQANRAFHRSVYCSSKNDVLIVTLNALWDQTDRYRIMLLRNGVSAAGALKEHSELAAALLKRDADRAAAVMRRHVEGTQRSIHGMADVF